MWHDFHFLSPVWFLALLPFGLLLWFAARAGSAGNAWRRLIDPRLLAVLSVGGEPSVRRWWPLALLATGWLLAVVALANPTFERQPVPAFRTDSARVVALDLSRSMLADDLTPTRLERARYKLVDILSRAEGGQVGLVVFAGDAFPVSPLTDDADTLLGMLDALAPEIMPVQGSRPDLAIEGAMALLRQAGARRGEVVLLTDDAGDQRALRAAEDLRAAGHRLAVIGVGTAEGAAVPGVRNANGPIIAALDAPALQALARAGGGRYSSLTTTDADLKRVLRDPALTTRALAPDDPMLTDAWKELGPWLALALLPLGALAFRRGWMLAIALLVTNLSLTAPRPAMAFGWDDLWQRRDQQAARALAEADYERARELAQDPLRSGTASYRLGDYDAAIDAFATGEGPDFDYNRGNALAAAGRLEDAIAAYEEALARAPDMADALHNKQQIEQWLERQQDQPRQDQPQHSDGGEQGEESNQQQSGSDQSQDQRAGERPSDQQEADDQANVEDASTDGQDGQQQDPSQEQDSDQPSQPRTGADDAQPQNGTQNETPHERQDGARDNDDGADGTSGANADQPIDNDVAPDEAEQERAEQAADDYRAEAAAQDADADEQSAREDAVPTATGGDEGLTPEERESRQAADQWLRRIPDDPAGLLRRKFLYQYRAKAQQEGEAEAGNPW